MPIIKCDLLEVIDFIDDDFDGSFTPGGIRSEDISYYKRTPEGYVSAITNTATEVILKVPFDKFEEVMSKIEEDGGTKN